MGTLSSSLTPKKAIDDSGLNPPSELWTEHKTSSHVEIMGSMVRAFLNLERVERIDLAYLGAKINAWWSSQGQELMPELAHSDLKILVLESIRSEHLLSILKVGFNNSGISAVLLEHTFKFADKRLAHLVHEVMTELAGIVDVKYPYEDHKELFPKSNDKLTSDWGRGVGIIRPHSDDLYEDRSVNAMCLTVCKDTSSTPTWFWLLKDITACLSDEELGKFALAEAIFLSGANVEGRVIKIQKPVLRMDPDEGIGMRIDFRIDDSVGPRMRFADEETQKIFDKMRRALPKLKPVCSTPTTGSVSILANYKILHGRSALNPIMLYEGESSRILFRSKGTKL